MPYTTAEYRRDRDESWKQLKKHMKVGALAPFRAGRGQSKAISKRASNDALLKKELMRWLRMMLQGVWFVVKILFFRLRLVLDK